MDYYLNVGEDNDGWYVAKGHDQIMFGLSEQNATEVCSLFKTIEQLQARVAELEAENARLKVMEESALKVCSQLDEVVIALPYDYLDPPDGGDVSLGEQVTRMYSEVKTLRHAVVIAQDEIKRLRDALDKCADKFKFYAAHHAAKHDWDKSAANQDMQRMCEEALAQPSDTSALDAYVAEKVKSSVEHAEAEAWANRNHLYGQITTLQDELEQCRKDAERYAWLRAEHDRIDPLGRVCWKRYDNRNGSEWCEVVDLDAAIDKAMESV